MEINFTPSLKQDLIFEYFEDDLTIEALTKVDVDEVDVS